MLAYISIGCLLLGWMSARIWTLCSSKSQYSQHFSQAVLLCVLAPLSYAYPKMFMLITSVQLLLLAFLFFPVYPNSLGTLYYEKLDPLKRPMFLRISLAIHVSLCLFFAFNSLVIYVFTWMWVVIHCWNQLYKAKDSVEDAELAESLKAVDEEIKAYQAQQGASPSGSEK